MSWLLRIVRGPDDDIDRITGVLWDIGTTGIAEVDEDGIGFVLAGFADRPAAERAVHALASEADVVGIVEVDDGDWPEQPPQRLEVAGRALDLEIGHAFGTGEHPTTRLVLDALVDLITPNTTVLDVGAGTGVLTMAAAVLGASRVVGVEIDTEAVAVARRNLAANRLEAQIVHGSIDSADGAFDLVVVNMLAAQLAPLAADVIARVAPGGRLVVSGFVVEQRSWVESMFTSMTASTFTPGPDGWAAATFTTVAPAS